MWTFFIATNLNFAINILAGLACLTTAWLYFDAKIRTSSLGFGLISISFWLAAVNLVWLNPISYSVRVTGLLLLIIQLTARKLQPHPKSDLSLVIPILFSTLSAFTSAASSLLVSLLYFRLSSRGLERHLRSLFYIFLVLSVSDAVAGLQSTLSHLPSPVMFEFTKQFGYLWLTRMVLLLLTAVLLIKWTYGYLLRQLKTQIFVLVNTIVTFSFVLSASIFTGLLLNQVSHQSLSLLETNTKVLNYSLESAKSQILSEVALLSQNPTLIANLKSKDISSLSKLATDYLLAKNKSSLIVLNPEGIVLTRGENPDLYADSMSNSYLLKQLSHQPLGIVSVAASQTGLVSQLNLQAAVPVVSDSTILGYLLASTPLDYSFIDGVHKATGLETAVYVGDQLTASSISDLNLVGSHLTNSEILDTVMTKNQIYTGFTNHLGTDYLSTYLPIVDADQVPVGMLFTGTPISRLIAISTSSLSYIYLCVIGILILSIPVVYYLARRIEYQFT